MVKNLSNKNYPFYTRFIVSFFAVFVLYSILFVSKAFAAPEFVSFSPSSASPGSTVTANGSGFSTNLRIEIIGLNADLNKDSICKSDAFGSFSCKFQIPSDLHLSTYKGPQEIYFEPSPGGKIITKAILNIIQGLPSIKLDPASGSLGDNINVMGSSFAPNVGVRFRGFDTDLSTNPSCVADSNGIFNCVFQIPKTLNLSKYSGSQVINAYASGSSQLGPTAWTTLTIKAPSTVFTLTPSSGDASKGITINGSNFPPNVSSIVIGGFSSPRELTTCNTNTLGQLVNCGISSCTILQTNPSNGPHTITALYDGTKIAEAIFTYTAGSSSQSCAPTTTPIAQSTACSLDSYVNDPTHPEHKAECACTFDKKAGIPNGSTYTAIGCLSSNLGTTLNTFLTIVIGIATIISLLRIVLGGYEIMTNPAGPEEIEEGRQIVTTAVLGLLFIILSIVILKIIGVDILGLGYLSQVFTV